MEKINLKKLGKNLNDFKEKFPEKFDKKEVIEFDELENFKEEENELSDLTETLDRSYEMDLDRSIYYEN